MIDKEKILELVNKFIEGSDLFLVDIQVSHSNDIKILIDRHEGISIEECVRLSKVIDNSLDRDSEDFQLEVSSPGLNEPLKVPGQYNKNLGRDVEVTTSEGKKHEGKLIRLTDTGFVIEELVKVKGEKKRPVIKSVETEFSHDMVQSVKAMVVFK